jgi:hypothetical protein
VLSPPRAAIAGRHDPAGGVDAPVEPTVVRFNFGDRPECLELVGVPAVSAIWDSDVSSIVGVGEGRPSTRFSFHMPEKKTKT